MIPDHPEQAGFVFAPPPSPPRPEHPAQTQQKEIRRVAGRIADDVIQFCREYIGRPFRGADLAAYVASRRGGSLSSPDRILRELRRDGVIAYSVERAASKYVVSEVRV